MKASSMNYKYSAIPNEIRWTKFRKTVHIQNYAYQLTFKNGKHLEKK